ncbi:MAG TPA: hypothetical protein EYP80_01030 [Candidatus Aenigmarchaeota archaeon]|nr:hypothetical protein [Candidatus Aenigmarchaeota archaeon]
MGTKENIVFYNSLELYCKFLGSLGNINYQSVADPLAEFLQENKKPKVISTGRGRTGLSGISGLQELYNGLEGTEYEFIPYSMEKDPINRHIREGDFVLVESGSGETKETVDDFKKAIKAKAKCAVIVGEENSTIYELAEKHDFPRIVLKLERTKKDEIYSPIGSEFEFKYWVLFHCSNSHITRKLGFDSDSYTERLDLYKDNAKFLDKIVDEQISYWLGELTNRYGHFVFDGVDQSGHVAEQFEMRFGHLGYESFMYKDSNRKIFKKGDCYVPITGSGNTDDLVRRSREDAIKKGADVMPITSNPESELAKLVEDRNIFYIPVLSEFQEILKNYSSDDRVSPPKGYVPRLPLFETNAYIVTNAFVAQIAENDGKKSRFMERLHV